MFLSLLSQQKTPITKCLSSCEILFQAKVGGHFAWREGLIFLRREGSKKQHQLLHSHKNEDEKKTADVFRRDRDQL